MKLFHQMYSKAKLSTCESRPDWNISTSSSSESELLAFEVRPGLLEDLLVLSGNQNLILNPHSH